MLFSHICNLNDHLYQTITQANSHWMEHSDEQHWVSEWAETKTASTLGSYIYQKFRTTLPKTAQTLLPCFNCRENPSNSSSSSRRDANSTHNADLGWTEYQGRPVSGDHAQVFSICCALAPNVESHTLGTKSLFTTKEKHMENLPTHPITPPPPLLFS